MKLFDACGPIHLQNADWTDPTQRTSIAASLIQGVYSIEEDRQQNRVNHNAEAPIWWEFFDFHLVEPLKTHPDSPTFGAIFKHQPPTLNQNTNTPKYVIVLRGILMEPDTRSQDLFIGMKLVLNALTLDPRYKTSLEHVQNIVAQVGPENVWLAGHSLGAAIALQIGKTMARQGLFLDAYIFNPPYLSAPIHMLTDMILPFPCRLDRTLSSILTAGLSALFKGTGTGEVHDPFTKLCEWRPYLFVNQHDPLGCGYIGYFEHREVMKKLGFSGIGIERMADKDVVVSVVSGLCGRDGDVIPTVNLVKNLNPMAFQFKLAHGIDQWWATDLDSECVSYKLE